MIARQRCARRPRRRAPARRRDPGRDRSRRDGAPVDTRGVAANGVSRNAAGDYDVRFTGDLSKCAIAATVTGTEAGYATVTPTVAADKKTTSVDVRTFDGTGAPADRGFHLHGIC